MRKLLWPALCALALSACLGHGHWPEAVSPNVTAGGRRIEGVDVFNSLQEWLHSGWARPEDGIMSGPVYVVLGELGTACIVPSDVWAVAQPRDYVTCQPWRTRRP